MFRDGFPEALPADEDKPTTSEVPQTTAPVFVQAALRRFQRDNNILALLDEEGLRRVAALAEHQVRPKDDLIIRQGDPGDGFYFLVEGQVRVTLEEKGGAEVARINAGGFFGEMALLNDQPRSATVWTVGPTTLLWFRKDEFLPLLDEYPVIREILSGVALQRTEENLWAVLFDDETVNKSLEIIEDDDDDADAIDHMVIERDDRPDTVRTEPLDESGLERVRYTGEAEDDADHEPDELAVDRADRADDHYVEPEPVTVRDGDDTRPTPRVEKEAPRIDATRPDMPRPELTRSEPGWHRWVSAPVGAAFAAGLLIGVLVGPTFTSSPADEALVGGGYDVEPEIPAGVVTPERPALELEEPDSALPLRPGEGEPKDGEEPVLKASPIPEEPLGHLDPKPAGTSAEVAERKRLRRWLMNAFSKGNYESAARVGNELRGKFEVDWETHFKTAEAERMSGQPAAALASYLYFVSAYPTNAYADDARFRAAEILEQLGHVDEAREYLTVVAEDEESNFQKQAAAKLR